MVTELDQARCDLQTLPSHGKVKWELCYPELFVFVCVYILAEYTCSRLESLSAFLALLILVLDAWIPPSISTDLSCHQLSKHLTAYAVSRECY